jgi:purine-binding chemotaxis protein CheW
MNPVQAADAAAVGSAASTRLLVHVKVRACDLGIPVEQVVEAVGFPREGLQPFPRRDHAIAGLIGIRDVPVPVVALDRWLPMGKSSPTGAERVLVLQSDGACVAIAVDAILGVKAVQRASIRTLVHASEAEAELFESVTLPSGAVPALCMLEVRRLMALGAAWCAASGVEIGGLAASQQRQPAVADRPIRHAVFSVSGALWAIPAAAVRHVMPAQAPELALNAGGRRIEICQWLERKLPVVSLTSQLDASTTEARLMVVLESEGRVIGIAVDRAVQLIDLRPGAVLRSDGELCAGITDSPDVGRASILHVQDLFEIIQDVDLGAANAAATAATAAAAATPLLPASSSPANYLVFETDRAYASMVTGLSGVIALDTETTADLVAGRPAMLTWRGRTVGVHMLPTFDGTESHYEPLLAFIVPVPRYAGCPDDALSAKPADCEAAGEQHIALAFRSLSDWVPASAVKLSSMRMGGVGELQMLALESDKRDASIIVVDLPQLAVLLS